MIRWRCLFLVYSRIDVSLSRNPFFRKRFVHELPDEEVNNAVDSFKSFPALVSDVTEQQAGIDFEVIHSKRPLSSLTKIGKDCWWPSPVDVAEELNDFSKPGKHHSIFVFWPQNNLQINKSIRSAGWGLGMGGSASSMGATYASVANTHSHVWKIPLAGEVWLHEWLHGVCYYFTQLGFKMPDGDADGGGRHGYIQSPETGWTDYYRDLMNGRVLEDGELTGIPKHAWRLPIQ